MTGRGRAHSRNGWVGQLQDAYLFLLGQYLQRRRVVAGGEQYLDELLGQPLGALPVHWPVERDHTAIGAGLIAGVGAFIGRLDRLAERAAARVVVLDDRARGPIELLDELAGGVEVEQVVERQLLAVQLGDTLQQVRGRANPGVERGLLVGVLAVAQVAHLLVGVAPRGREPLVGAAREPGRDRGVVAGG